MFICGPFYSNSYGPCKNYLQDKCKSKLLHHLSTFIQFLYSKIYYNWLWVLISHSHCTSYIATQYITNYIINKHYIIYWTKQLLILSWKLLMIWDYFNIRYSSFPTSCLQAPNCEWMPIFLVHSIETRVFNHSTRVFNHSTRVFKFVGRHGFTSIHSISNSSSMHCEYITNWDSSLHVHTS